MEPSPKGNATGGFGAQKGCRAFDGGGWVEVEEGGCGHGEVVINPRERGLGGVPNVGKP